MIVKFVSQFYCECGSELRASGPTATPDRLQHDQFARDPQTHALIETKPLDCKYAGQWFEIPIVELRPFMPKK